MTTNWTCRELQLDLGQQHEGHAHWADHLTVIVRGPVRIDWKDPDGTEGTATLDRGDSLLIPAPRFHTFTALHERGAAWRCVFNYADAIQQGAPQDQWDKDK